MTTRGISGRSIVVTGGCGSIGAPVVERLLSAHDPETVTVLDNDEQAIFEYRCELDPIYDAAALVLADVRDAGALERAFDGADVVVHTAAVKHVPIGERHPSEAIRTNVEGTKNVIDAAARAGVDRVLGVSTDKAVAPNSVMGATKLLGERLFQAASHGIDGTEYGCVRLGNVFGSRGSVVETFREQVRAGGPVTLTHEEMTRFVTTIDDVVSFLLSSLETATGGTVHVPKMDAIRIADLAEATILEYAPPDVSPTAIDVEIIGPRPGEHLHERLIGEAERRYARDRHDRIVIESQTGTPERTGDPQLAERAFTSERADKLSIREIRSLLRAVDPSAGARTEIAPSRALTDGNGRADSGGPD